MTMSDENLAAFVAEVRTVTPSAGESLVTGSLRSQGYYVSRERVREALRSSDPLGSALRWPGVSTYRRPYSVAGPNSLWHIGNIYKFYLMYYSELHNMYTLHVVHTHWSSVKYAYMHAWGYPSYFSAFVLHCPPQMAITNWCGGEW